MTLKKSKDIRQLCYPFIYETSPLCDHEIITDELCTTLGGVIYELEGDKRFQDIYDFLCELQPKIFDLGASIRAKQAIFAEDVEWLLGYFDRYQAELDGRLKSFILPRGGRPVQLLHACRSQAKKTVRAMVAVDKIGINVPDPLHYFANTLCNLLFRLTVVINGRLGIKEVEYTSKSYFQKRKSRKNTTMV